MNNKYLRIQIRQEYTCYFEMHHVPISTLILLFPYNLQKCKFIPAGFYFDHLG